MQLLLTKLCAVSSCFPPYDAKLVRKSSLKVLESQPDEGTRFVILSFMKSQRRQVTVDAADIAPKWHFRATRGYCGLQLVWIPVPLEVFSSRFARVPRSTQPGLEVSHI